ncbi:MAG: hypothetical protein EOO73_34120 [Myxococcales bacterium]|nr:MAG: hypothetical protein EOO73_34120 [Myxococcales bacterium]
MRGSLKTWSGLVLVAAAGACSNIIGVSELEIDPSLDSPGEGGSGGTSSGGKSAGGKSSGGSSVIPQAGEDGGGAAGTSQGGTPAGGAPGGGDGGLSGEGGIGGEPTTGCPTDCDDEIACTVDTCLPSGKCKHTADDTACSAAAGKCTSCQLGIGCVDSEPVEKDVELLLDGNFDEQSGDWQQFGDADAILPDATAQSGSHSAYFSAAPLDAEEPAFIDITQLVYIPPGTIKLTASGWYKMIWAPAEDVLRPRSDEYVTLTLWSLADNDGDYTRYHDFDQWDADQGPAQTAWKSFTYDAPKSVLSKIQDLEVTLDLVSETWDTTYYFDTLSLKMSVCE